MKPRICVLFVFVYCFWAAEGQHKGSKRSSNEEPVKFNTKSKDNCEMLLSGKDELKLRVECKNQSKQYWCEYAGKPSLCRSFNGNPKLYWHQISLVLRKTTNACQATDVLKPSMCYKAPAEAHMKQTASSLKQTTQKPAKATPGKLGAKAPPANKTPKAVHTTTAKPTAAASGPSEVDKMAQEYCWESLQGVCSFFIGLFKG